MGDRSYREQSRIDWVRSDGASPSLEQLTFGAVQRIANATEAMAQEHTKLIRERDNYKQWWVQQRERAERVERSNRSLRGVVTRLKRKAADAAGRPRIYLDMDGVMADFDRAYLERFGVMPRDHEDKIVWANIDGCGDFFRMIKPCPGALFFYGSIKHLSPTILTACPKTNYHKAAQHKREWVHTHLGKDVQVLPVMGGTNKPLFMHAPGDILIDDYRRNTEAWTAAGGVAILHRSWDATYGELFDALKMKPEKLVRRR